jgi:hypothetical protein
MTKNFGQDFDSGLRSREKGSPLVGIVVKAVTFLIPIALGLAALYIGKYGFGG